MIYFIGGILLAIAILFIIGFIDNQRDKSVKPHEHFFDSAELDDYQ
jgi:hypothetical protein